MSWTAFQLVPDFFHQQYLPSALTPESPEWHRSRSGKTKTKRIQLATLSPCWVTPVSTFSKRKKQGWQQVQMTGIMNDNAISTSDPFRSIQGVPRGQKGYSRPPTWIRLGLQQNRRLSFSDWRNIRSLCICPSSRIRFNHWDFPRGCNPTTCRQTPESVICFSMSTAKRFIPSTTGLR